MPFTIGDHVALYTDVGTVTAIETDGTVIVEFPDDPEPAEVDPHNLVEVTG